MALQVEVSARTQGDQHVSSVVRLTGVLEPAGLPVAERETKAVFDAPPKVVIFDLSGVSFVTSAGISFLLVARKTLEAKGSTVYFSAPQPQVRKVLDIMRALPSGSLFASEAELDEYLAEMQRKVSEGE